MQRILIPTSLTNSLLAGFLFIWIQAWTAVASGQQQTLPSADEVLDAFYEALGGEMAISSVSDVRFTGSYGRPGNLEVKYKSGKFVLGYDMGDSGQLRLGFDGTKWWRSHPRRRIEILQGEDMAMARQYSVCSPRFLEWRDIDGAVEIVEGTDFRGTAVWHVKFTDDEGVVVDRFFDQESGLLVATKVESEKADSTMLYEFEDFEGVLWASRLVNETKIKGNENVYATEILFTDYDFDAQLNDDDFAMPGDYSDD
ncbi:MAG: hypothetical protein ACR2NP_15665 [Pirellulaceae bacterium]